jgi:hypothetical protein
VLHDPGDLLDDRGPRQGHGGATGVMRGIFEISGENVGIGFERHRSSSNWSGDCAVHSSIVVHRVVVLTI